MGLRAAVLNGLHQCYKWVHVCMRVILQCSEDYDWWVAFTYHEHKGEIRADFNEDFFSNYKI